MITLHFNGTTLKIHEDDSSYRHRALGEKTTLTLKFSMPEFIEIPVGAWCEYQGETFTLNKAENFKKNNSRDLEYTLILGDPSELLGEYKLRNPVDRRLKWSMCATPREFVQAIVDNLNQRAGSGWSVGACIEASEKTIEFNHAYCDAALSTVANEFKTEFEIIGKQISLHKVEYFKNDPLPLGYGKGNGFKPGVGRSTQSDQKPIKRLYVQGGDRNIDRSKYGSAELLLPKGQQLSYEGKVYKADNDGYYIERVTPASSARKEDSLDLSEIYPSRVGEVSSVVVVDASKNWYDFIDNTIPENLNFNDYIIAGETPVVIFQTGMLSGNDRQFEFKYDHETRRFELKPQEIDGVTMPNNTFKPVVGNKYAIFGIMLPDEYICNNLNQSGASWDMFREAVRYLSENEDTKFTFSGELQSVFTKKNWLRIGGRLKVGSYILFTDEQFAPDGVLIRIVGIKDYTTSPYTPIITISNEARGVDVNSKLNEIGQNEIKIDESHNDAIRYTKRRFRDATETMQMLEQSLLDNYTNSINPIAVHTMQMLVGDESLQFRFVASKTNLSAVPYNITYDNESKVLTCPHGYLQHMTLGIKTLASSHEPNEYLVWEMSEYESPVLTDGAKNYYLYARVHRTNTNLTGSFLLSHTAIGMKQEANYYHLLVGVLNTEYDGERSFATLYGFTEILPGRVTTDKVVAADGESFFDMLNSALKLKDKLQFNVNGDGELLLKGTFVQSQSGDKAPIGCYRGIYNSSYTYYEGDMVIYAVDGKYSLYRRYGAQSTKGIPPTNENYWEVQASCGGNGDWVSYVFKESENKPVKPTGEATIPTGWSDAPTSTGRWWMSKATINGGTGKAGTWSEPVQVTAEDGVDGAYTDFKYRKNGSDSTAPAIDKTSRNPANWTDEPPALSAGEFLWMSCAEINPDNTLKTDWSDPVRISGEKGDNGDFYEIRYAVNGSTTEPPSMTAEMKAQRNPSGWSTAQPTVGTLKYLWMTTAKISGETDALLSNWSTPIRITPYDGKDGQKGDSPVLVYRGVYNSSKTYYGNSKRVDAVKYGNTWYVARNDAPNGTAGYSGHEPTDTDYWNQFGASFESVATNLLLAEGANIGDWFISAGRIVSTLDETMQNRISIQVGYYSGSTLIYQPKIVLESSMSGGDYTMETDLGSIIEIDASRGIVEARSKSGYSAVSYISPTGVFANRAGTQALPASTGRTFRAAIVGLGFANVNKSEWELGVDETMIAGVYGRASNSGTAPAYGGYFENLYASGIVLGRKCITGTTDNTTYLSAGHTLVIGYTSATATVYLPSSPREGQIIYFKQWWSGKMRVRPYTGHKIYDDTRENEYYDFGEGQGGMFVFTIGYITSGSTTTKVETWLVSRWKF